MKLCHKLIFLFLIITFHALLLAQTSDPSLLTLERIYKDGEFSSKSIGRTKWFDNGNGYTRLEKSKSMEGSKDIVQYNIKTGKRKILVPANRLIPAGDTKPLTIEDYNFSDNKKFLLIFTNAKRVWRRNTRGDYWFIRLNKWEMKKLGGKAKPSTLMFATFSPDFKNVAYVMNNNLYVESVENHKITQLTTDGSKTIINGTFDWVYEEEFSLRNGFRWSPDGKKIAYWQLDAEGVGVFNLINNTDSLYSFIIPVQYPKVGTTNSACKVGVVNTVGGKTTWFNVDGDSRNFYIARMDWAANSKEIILQKLNRLQNTNKVIIGNAFTGKVQNIYTDKDETWVDAVDDLKWCDNGKRFTWVSESDGWKHVFLISRNGKNVGLITPGEFDVISIQRIDEKNGWLYYIASPENPTQRYLFRSRLNSKAKPQKLTPGDQSGTHVYRISPNCKWAFHTYSSMDNPPIHELISLPNHKSVRILEDNSELRTKVKTLKRKPTEFFRVDIGEGVLLDGYQIKPYNFDPVKKYPVLFYVYGEPWGQTARDAWGGNTYLWHLMLAQQGYIIMSIDNRGTPSPRGRDWRKCIYRQIGILASADQAAAVRVIRKWEYVDSTRIGIWGWSGGGSMSLNAIFRYPDLYHTAMAIASVPDQRYYDTIYQERYMGLPEDNAEGYKNGSPITFARQLKGNLLLVHGTGDDNVHYQGAEALINELIKHNKHFTMMAYPNRSHGIYEGTGTTLHLRKLLTRYLFENLPAGPSE